jgi:predicted kinase
MKDIIKSILRESNTQNSLGVTVTKPNQELIIMVGVPGSGKSTKAKQLVGKGIIHSTDDVIELMGDYREFFEKMVSSGDFKPLSDVHKRNFQNAVTSMKQGYTPVIIDNTNLSPSEPKKYVEAALTLGYSDDNIKFINIGTNGLSAEELAQRNTHGVALDKIKSMIQKYKNHGGLSLSKVLSSKDMESNSKMFASLVLDDASRSKLLEEVSQYIPEGWKVIAHHMTINFGKGLPERFKGDLGKQKTIKAIEIGISEMAIAVKVSGYYSDNKIPHITIAINPNGGKPVMSNNITDWESLDGSPIELHGTITEQKLG